jgi:hypothetical protein
METNKDLHNNIKQVQAIIPAAIGANATKTGAIIDRKGYGGVEFIISYGSVTTTGSVVTAVLKEGDVTGTLTSVADADLIGTETLASLAAGARVAGTGKEVAKRLGYKGNKRYVQLSLVQTGTTSAGAVAADAILFNPSLVPTSNP